MKQQTLEYQDPLQKTQRVNSHAWSSPAPLPCPRCRRVWCLFGGLKNTALLYSASDYEREASRGEKGALTGMYDEQALPQAAQEIKTGYKPIRSSIKEGLQFLGKAEGC